MQILAEWQKILKTFQAQSSDVEGLSKLSMKMKMALELHICYVWMKQKSLFYFMHLQWIFKWTFQLSFISSETNFPTPFYGPLVEPQEHSKGANFQSEGSRKLASKNFPNRSLYDKTNILTLPTLENFCQRSGGERSKSLSPYCFKSVEDSILLWLLSTLMFLLKFLKSGHSNLQCFEI